MARLVVIAAGGTGGHMFPAQATAEALLARGWRVALASDARGLRYAGGFAPAVERHALRAATTARGGLLDKAAAPFTVVAGVAETIAWFRRERPAVVAGFGGYPSLPAIAAARALGLPRLIHEQNGVLGRVNRLFARSVDVVATGVAEIANAPSGARIEFVGNPIRASVRARLGEAYAPPSAYGPIALVVIGGSQGAGVFAALVPGAIARLEPGLRARLTVAQQARPDDLAAVEAAYAAAGVAAEVRPFFEDAPARMAAATLVIARAGASTLAELAALGRPALLAPYPHATADHQTANARVFQRAGAAIAIPDAATTPESLAHTLTELLEAPERLAAMARAARGLGRPDAAEDLADLVERTADRAG